MGQQPLYQIRSENLKSHAAESNAAWLFLIHVPEFDHSKWFFIHPHSSLFKKNRVPDIKISTNSKKEIKRKQYDKNRK